MVDEVVNNRHAGRWGSEWCSIPSSLTPLSMECDRWCRSHSSNHLSHPCPNNSEGQRMEWFCKSSRKNQESAPVIALSALPWKRQPEVEGRSHTSAFVVPKSRSKPYQDMAQADIVHMPRPLEQFKERKGAKRDQSWRSHWERGQKRLYKPKKRSPLEWLALRDHKKPPKR